MLKLHPLCMLRTIVKTLTNIETPEISFNLIHYGVHKKAQ